MSLEARGRPLSVQRVHDMAVLFQSSESMFEGTFEDENRDSASSQLINDGKKGQEGDRKDT